MDIEDKAVREVVLETIRKQKGCRGNFKAGYTLDRIVKLTTCPGNLFSFWAAGTVKAWMAYRSGTMPNEGGLFDQSAKVFEAFAVLDRLEAETAKK